MKYYDMLGGFLSSLILYLFMLGCGYFFGSVKLLKKEGLVAFTKMVIDIFLPVYIFIHVCRSTFTQNFVANGALIVSFLFYLIIAGGAAFLWAYFSKMDLRYRFTFICLTAFIDIRRLHYLYINSFCYFLKFKTKEERSYCSNLVVDSEVHTFFQGIIIWYVAFNLIRLDKTYARQSEELWHKIHLEENNNSHANLISNRNKNTVSLDTENENQTILTEEDKTKLKEIYQEHKVKSNLKQIKDTEKGEEGGNKDNDNKTNNDNPMTSSKIQGNGNQTQHIRVVGSESFYKKISQFSKAKFFKNEDIWKEIVYIMMRPPIIALFIGFVVGFIRVIRLWLFDTTTPVYLFFDTFNNIGNCNILIALLIIGANLALDNSGEANKAQIEVRRIDYIVHLVFKIVILPFFGVIFGFVTNKHFFPENKALSWSCFIQWFLPTSSDIMIIIQLKDINVKFVAICIFVQYIAQAFINDLIHLPPMMSVLGVLN